MDVNALLLALLRAGPLAAARTLRGGAPPPLVSFLQTAWHGWRATVLDPFYWVFLALLALTQLCRPAVREQRRPSPALAEDATWFMLSTVVIVSALGASVAPLNFAYEHLTGGRALNLTPAIGVWGVAVVAFVVGDLLAWYSHWLHHHVGGLWYFHAVHHSQTNLNVLSDNRQHFVETVVNTAVAYLPARALGLSSPDALRLASLTIYFSAFIHTNVRTNLGPVGYLIVSPQAHRVHHSADVEHFNTNYGTVFSFWDLIFRTRSDDVDSYPTTGIDDLAFPHGTSANPAGLVVMWVKQSVYPFRLALRGTVAYAGNGTAPTDRGTASVSYGSDASTNGRVRPGAEIASSIVAGRRAPVVIHAPTVGAFGMYPKCIFCRFPAVTRQYVWPDRLRSDFAAPAPGVQMDVGQTVDFVCSTCAQGWIRRLDTAVEPALSSIAAGTTTRLSPRQQDLLARWAAKAAFVIDHIDNPQPVPRVACEFLRNVGIHEGTQVLLGRYQGNARRLTVDRDRFRRADQPGALACQTTLVIGEALLQVFVDPWADRPPSLDDPAAALTPLVPVHNRTIQWPLKTAITDTTYDVVRRGSPSACSDAPPREAGVASRLVGAAS